MMASDSVYSRLEEPDPAYSGQRCFSCGSKSSRCETFSVSIFVSITSVIACGIFLTVWTYLQYNHHPLDSAGAGKALFFIGIALVVFGILCALVVLAMWVRRKRKRPFTISIIRAEPAPPVDLNPIEMNLRRDSV